MKVNELEELEELDDFKLSSLNSNERKEKSTGKNIEKKPTVFIPKNFPSKDVSKNIFEKPVLKNSSKSKVVLPSSANFMVKLKQIYFKWEDKYYEFLDKVDKKFPVNKHVDKIDKIFPSFALLLILFFLLILFLGWNVLLGIFPGLFGGINPAVLMIVDDSGNVLEGIDVSIVLGSEELLRKTNDKGIIELLQTGDAKIKIEKDGFEKYESMQTLESGERIVINLSTLFAEDVRRILVIRDASNREPITQREITASFSCSGNAFAPSEVVTNRSEVHVIEPAGCDTLSGTIRVDGYEEKTKSLTTSRVFFDLTPLEDISKNGKIEVTVKDSEGNILSGIKLSLHKDTGTLNLKYITTIFSSESGNNYFETELGNYKIIAMDDFGEYSQAESNLVQLKTQGETQIVNLVMEKNAPSDRRKIFVKVVDKNTGSPIGNSSVLIFSNGLFVTNLTTNTDGIVTYEGIDSNKNYDITAFHTDFVLGVFPNVQLVQLNELQPVLLELEKTGTIDDGNGIIPANYGIIDVNVLDERGQSIKNAGVFLYNSNVPGVSLFLEKKSNDLGMVRYSNLPLDGNYYAEAYNILARGNSISARLTRSTVLQLPVYLVVGKGTVIAKVVNGLTGAPIRAANVKILNNIDKNILGSLLTNEAGLTTPLEIKVDKRPYLQVDMNGFLSTTSRFYYIVANEELTIEVLLYPNNIENDFQMIFDGVYDKASNERINIFNAGREYVFKFNLVGKGTFSDVVSHFRTGKDSTSLDDLNIFVVDSQNIVGATPVKSTTFNAQDVFDNGNATSGFGKQINVYFEGNKSNFAFDVPIISMVDGNTLRDTKVQIHYQAKGEKNGEEIITPLGTQVYTIGNPVFCDSVRYSCPNFIYSFKVISEEEEIIEPDNSGFYNFRKGVTYTIEYEIWNQTSRNISNAVETITDGVHLTSVNNLTDNLGIIPKRGSIASSITFTTEREGLGSLLFSLNAGVDDSDANVPIIVHPRTPMKLILSPPLINPSVQNHVFIYVLDELNNPIRGAIIKANLDHNRFTSPNIGIGTTNEDGFFVMSIDGPDKGREIFFTVEKSGFINSYNSVVVGESPFEKTTERFECLTFNPDGNVFTPTPDDSFTFSAVNNCSMGIDLHLTQQTNYPLTLEKEIVSIPAGESVIIRVERAQYPGQYGIVISAKVDEEPPSMYTKVLEYLVFVGSPDNSCFSIEKTEFDIALTVDNGKIINDNTRPECYTYIETASFPRITIESPDVYTKFSPSTKSYFARTIYLDIKPDGSVEYVPYFNEADSDFYEMSADGNSVVEYNINQFGDRVLINYIDVYATDYRNWEVAGNRQSARHAIDIYDSKRFEYKNIFQNNTYEVTELPYEPVIQPISGASYSHDPSNPGASGIPIVKDGYALTNCLVDESAREDQDYYCTTNPVLQGVYNTCGGHVCDSAMVPPYAGLDYVKAYYVNDRGSKVRLRIASEEWDDGSKITTKVYGIVINYLVEDSDHEGISDFNVFDKSLAGDLYTLLTIEDSVNESSPHFESQPFHIKLDTKDDEVCYSWSNVEGRTGPKAVPKNLFTWNWNRIDANDCIVTEEGITNYCDSTQFSIVLLRRLKAVYELLLENQYELRHEYLNFPVALIQDGYSEDFQKDFDSYYSNRDFANTPIWYLDDFSKIFSDPNRVEFTDPTKPVNPRVNVTPIDGPGIYQVNVKVDFDDDSLNDFFNSDGSPNVRLKVYLQKIRGPFQDNPFYYLPIDGYVGVTDSGMQRTGYGRPFKGESVKVVSKGEDLMELTSYDTASENALTIERDEDFANLNKLRRGILLELTNEKMNARFSSASPLLMVIEEDSEGLASQGYYLKKDGQVVNLGRTLVPWEGIGSTMGMAGICTEFQNNYLFDKYYDAQFTNEDRHPVTCSLNIGANSAGREKSYGFSFDPSPAGREGDRIVARTIFYTPISESWSLQPSCDNLPLSGSLPSFKDAKGSLIKRIGENISLDYTQNYKFAGIETKLDSIARMFEMIESGDLCSKMDRNLFAVWWNEEKLFDDLAHYYPAQEDIDYSCLNISDYPIGTISNPPVICDGNLNLSIGSTCDCNAECFTDHCDTLRTCSSVPSGLGNFDGTINEEFGINTRLGLLDYGVEWHSQKPSLTDKKNYLDYARKANVGYIREYVMNWPQMVPINGGTPDFSHYDDIVMEAQNRGLKIVAVFPMMPCYETTASGVCGPNDFSLNDPRFKMPLLNDSNSFGDFIHAFVERYDYDGLDDMPGLTQRIKHYEFMTGEDSYYFNPSPESYYDLLKFFYEKVKEKDPSAKIILGGLRKLGPSDITSDTFFKKLLDIHVANDELPFFDIISFHSYPEDYSKKDDPTVFDNTFKYLVDEFNHYKASSSRQEASVMTPTIWMTETGDSMQDGEDKQAERLVKYMIHAKSLEYNGVKMDKVFWFTLWDLKQGESMPELTGDSQGLVKHALSGQSAVEKSSLLALRILGNLTRDMINIERVRAGIYKISVQRSVEEVYVAWSENGNATIDPELNGPIIVTDLDGKLLKTSAEGYVLTDEPVFIYKYTP